MRLPITSEEVAVPSHLTTVTTTALMSETPALAVPEKEG